MTCPVCGRELTRDEIAVYRRLVFREADDCLCKTCFAARLHVPEEEIDKKIAHFKSIGCTLFSR